MTFRILDDDKIDVHLADNGGWKILHYSVMYGSYESMSFLVERGANINSKTNDGKNCLHLAAYYGHTHLCNKLIYNNKFDVNLADNIGWTALHYSAQSGNYELFTYFVDMGIDMFLKTNTGMNCLHIASTMGI